MIRTSGQVSAVAALGNDVGDEAGSTTSTALLDGGGVVDGLDGVGALLAVLGGDLKTLAVLGGRDADGLGVDNTRVLRRCDMTRGGGGQYNVGMGEGEYDDENLELLRMLIGRRTALNCRCRGVGSRDGDA